jgi:hypothetical protein
LVGTIVQFVLEDGKIPRTYLAINDIGTTLYQYQPTAKRYLVIIDVIL